MVRTQSRRDEARYRAAERAVWERHGIVPEEYWIDVRDLGIRERALVHGEGRPVVFVHGNPTAGGVFVPLAAALPGIRAIVVDRPGCGLSDPMSYDGITPEGLHESAAAYLEAVIVALAGDRADLVGNSAGGMAALVTAARRPERVRTVVVEGVPSVQGMRLPWLMRAATVGPVAGVAARHDVKARELKASLRAMGHGGTLDSGGVSREDLEYRLAVSRFSDTYRHDLDLLGRAASWRGPRPGWVPRASDLEAVEAPTLWLVGERDPFTPPGGVGAWAARMPRATVHVLVGQGHQPWIDDPEEHAHAIARWWESLAA